MKNIAILGSTGSIGVNALNVIQANPTSGQPPLDVQFTVTVGPDNPNLGLVIVEVDVGVEPSLFNPEVVFQFTWDFEEGDPPAGAFDPPLFRYDNEGVYTASVTARTDETEASASVVVPVSPNTTSPHTKMKMEFGRVTCAKLSAMIPHTANVGRRSECSPRVSSGKNTRVTGAPVLLRTSSGKTIAPISAPTTAGLRPMTAPT